MQKATTLGELKKSGYQVVSVKDELRRNVLARLRNNQPLFPGIIGYDDTVIPAFVNAVLARHDILLLGLRGQAKTRIVRSLPLLLDEYIPVIRGAELNDNPYNPISKYGRDLAMEYGDETPIEWLHREARFGEKLATPDVTIADLIGDIDPIKAASQRLHYSHEGAIHYGLIPRVNRGIFAINELPDLQPRIQVGLFNIMEEKDVQIRGFNIRIPLDVMIIFTANPEDYTNRGNIITPLKDRIDSQIITHYPHSVKEAMDITQQEAWMSRDGRDVTLPYYFREIIEHIAFEARRSEYVDQKSGVSARLTIAVMENLVSNAERRAVVTDEDVIVPRICDLAHVLPGMTGKIELVFEGEQEGAIKVSKALVGRAVREVFKQYFPDPLQRRSVKVTPERQSVEAEYRSILQWFDSGNHIDVADTMNTKEYSEVLEKVPGLKKMAEKYMPESTTSLPALASTMEFILDGLHQFSKIAKDEVHGTTTYKDMVGSIFTGRGSDVEEEY